MEAVLIVASVALGFVVNEWRQAVADRELAARVIRNVRAEVEHNLATIGPQVKRHQQIIKTLAANNGRERQGAWDVLLTEMEGNERYVLELYEKHLPALRAAPQ